MLALCALTPLTPLTAQQAPDNQLRLQYAQFDPALSAPEIPAVLQADPNSTLHVVQGNAQVDEALRATIRAAGGTHHHYLHERSYLVRIAPERVADLRRSPLVRAVVPFHPAYKLAPEIRADLVAGTELATDRYVVMLVDRQRDEVPLTQAIERLDGDVVTVARGNVLLEAQLDQRGMLALLREDTVLWIQRWTAPEEDMDIVRAFGGANALETKTGFTGKGIRGHIMEGIYPNHTEFPANAYRSLPIGLFDTTGTTHGNATFGVIFARGAAPTARGLCPDGQGLFTNYNYVYGNNNRYTVVKDLVDPTKSHLAMFQTASWGYGQITAYDARSAEMDRIIFDHDMPITQSQSNTGNQTSRPQAWAKNIISVGALSHYNTLTPTDDRWTSASYGPASDLRIKPDLCAFYDSIYTTYSSTGYGQFGGTSGATPIVAGHLGLVIEMFTDGHFGYPKAPAWNQRFAFCPHFTTTKALLVNTAMQYDPAVNGGITRIRQGWGFPNVNDLYDLRDKMLVVDELDVLAQNGKKTYGVFVRPGTAQFRTTMVYSDPEATVPTVGPHRINNLDLKVTSPSGLVYHGNNGLSGIGLVSTPGGSPNNLDTVENVLLRNPQAGIWLLEVAAPLVAVDQHKETQPVDADYALVSSGLGGMRDTSGAACAFTSAQTGDLRVTVSRQPASYSEGFTFFSAASKRPLASAEFFGLEIDAMTYVSLSVSAAEGNPLHFTKTTNQNAYPNAPFVFDPALATALKGMTFDALAVFVDASGNVVDVTNVSRVTVQ